MSETQSKAEMLKVLEPVAKIAMEIGLTPKEVALGLAMTALLHKAGYPERIVDVPAVSFAIGQVCREQMTLDAFMDVCRKIAVVNGMVKEEGR